MLNREFKEIKEVLVFANEKDNGAQGKNFEIALRKAVQKNARRNDVSAKGCVDIKFMEIGEDGKRHAIKVECKTGAGELGVRFEDGSNDLEKHLFKNDYLFYAPLGFDGKVYIFEPREFVEKASNINRIRWEKTSTLMNERKKAGEEWYKDRVAIQSFKFKDRPNILVNWLEFLEENCLMSF